MFPTSFSDRKQAAAAALGDRTARRLDQLVIPDADEFDAQITAISGSDYSWLRQLYDPATGDFYPDPAGLSGSTTWMPAREMNNAVISTFPFYARLTRRAVLRAADGSPVYEFPAGGGPSIIGTYQTTNQTVNSGAGFTWTSGLEASSAGLYLVSANINAGSLSAGAVASFLLRRTGTTSSAGFWPYFFNAVTVNGSTSVIVSMTSLLTVTSADVSGGNFGIDLRADVTIAQMFLGGSVGTGISLAKLS